MYNIAYPLYFVVHFFSTFWSIEKIERMMRMKEDSNYFDLIDLVDIVTTSSIVYPDYFFGFMSTCWYRLDPFNVYFFVLLL